MVQSKFGVTIIMENNEGITGLFFHDGDSRVTGLCANELYGAQLFPQYGATEGTSDL